MTNLVTKVLEKHKSITDTNTSSVSNAYEQKFLLIFYKKKNSINSIDVLGLSPKGLNLQVSTSSSKRKYKRSAFEFQ